MDKKSIKNRAKESKNIQKASKQFHKPSKIYQNSRKKAISHKKDEENKPKITIIEHLVQGFIDGKCEFA